MLTQEIFRVPVLLIIVPCLKKFRTISLRAYGKDAFLSSYSGLAPDSAQAGFQFRADQWTPIRFEGGY